MSLPVSAQDRAAQDRPATVGDEDVPEYTSVVAAVHTIVDILQNVTRRHAAEPISDQLENMSMRLTDAADVTYGGFRGPDPLDDDLVKLLKSVERDLHNMVRTLEDRGDDRLAVQLEGVIAELNRAISQVENEEQVIARGRTGKWYDTGWYNGDERRRVVRTRDERRRAPRTRNDDDDRRWGDWGDLDDRETWNGRRGDDDDSDDRDWDDHDWDWDDHWDWRWTNTTENWIGDFSGRWPYSERSLYSTIPPVRYNRVEGSVVGIKMDPLEWSDFDRGRVYGQVGYAFGLDDWRYEVGAESRLLDVKRNPRFDVKIGGGYHQNTSTRDLWKASWAENSLAAGLFRHDFFDYYETEGWTLYLVARATPYLQFSAGYREDAYRSMEQNVTWSLFGGDSFRANPAIQEGDMNSLVFALEGGQVKGMHRRPSGGAFRLEAEIGQGLGGDFDFSRYVGDVRGYARLSRLTGFNIRMRGGFTEGDVPLQKAFTIGGIGSVRSYSQNVFLGTRMLLANAELELYEAGFADWLLDDATLIGLFDAGWTNTGGQNEFSFDDVIPSAGLGLAFEDRNLRLELAWPLKDLGTGREPTLWLRLNPTF